LNCDLSLFLYAKGIKNNSTPESRIQHFIDLLYAESLFGIAAEIKKNLIMSRERLVRIVEANEESYDFSNNSESLFSKFVQSHPEWKFE
jgi:hypothetical protein